MAKKSLLPHGFKAEANRKAIKFRSELGLESHEPLCGFELAKYLDIEVYTPREIFPVGTDFTKLIGTKDKSSGWSALTMSSRSDNKIIIHNDLHSSSRQQSNIMHELSHIICKHTQPEEREGINLPSLMRDFNPQQEEEAIYLGGALQITREGLLWALKKNMSYDEIAAFYNASISMVIFRVNSTGVKRQMNFWR